jgi:hypothetical protein
MKSTWRKNRDSLYRGDEDDGVSVPVPDADDSIVRHVLYLGGRGRDTPYSSTSEVREIAQGFAERGRVWKTTVAAANGLGVGHIGRVELLGLLKGKGKGRAKWDNAFEVLQAARYVDLHAEHLLDFSPIEGSPEPDVQAVVSQLFDKA